MIGQVRHVCIVEHLLFNVVFDCLVRILVDLFQLIEHVCQQSESA